LTDSNYLRERLLKPVVAELVGDVTSKVVLDIGTGDGWVTKELRPKSCAEIDVVTAYKRLMLSKQDARALAFKDGVFDTVVACLSLMWFQELNIALKEAVRTTCFGGEIVIAIPHPYTYRSGEVRDGLWHFTVNVNVARVIENLYIAGEIGPFTYFHRPFHAWVNSVVSSGWRIEAIEVLTNKQARLENFSTVVGGHMNDRETAVNVAMKLGWDCILPKGTYVIIRSPRGIVPGRTRAVINRVLTHCRYEVVLLDRMNLVANIKSSSVVFVETLPSNIDLGELSRWSDWYPDEKETSKK